jgi:hypothetical protein
MYGLKAVPFRKRVFAPQHGNRDLEGFTLTQSDCEFNGLID